MVTLLRDITHTHTQMIDYVSKIKLEFVVLFGNANLNGENMLCDIR